MAVLRSRLDQLEHALRDIATVIARTAAANFLLVKVIILSPELSIHGKRYTLSIDKTNT
jgi:hypothetical protein